MDNNILQSAPFVSALVAMLLAQLIKPVVYLVSEGKFDLKLIFANGGMPSSHTSAVSAMTISFGLKNGFSSDIFVLSFIMLLIVMNDAINVRLETGKQSKLLNEWSEIFSSMFKEFSRQHLKTMVGHTSLQVFWGMLLGLVCGLVITLKVI